MVLTYQCPFITVIKNSARITFVVDKFQTDITDLSLKNPGLEKLIG